MNTRLTTALLAGGLALGWTAGPAWGQTKDVRLFPNGPQDPDGPKIQAAAKALRDEQALLDMPAVKAQLTRTTCELKLPPPREKKLTGREIWQAARRSYMRIGWYHLCTNCDKWHLRLAGGYVVTADGVVATCDHVIRPDEKGMREGFLLAADDDGHVFPVTALLACNEAGDAALIRVKAEGLTPLPLNTDVAPGDGVWCYSEPMGRRGYFSQGIVNRFVVKSRSPKDGAPVAINVSADWAPGSSGAALLDDRGNAIGHVSVISPLWKEDKTAKKDSGTFLVVHEATSASEVLRLVQP